jgi:hypothetical protein
MKISLDLRYPKDKSQMIVTEERWKHIKKQKSRKPFRVYPDIAVLGCIDRGWG